MGHRTDVPTGRTPPGERDIPKRLNRHTFWCGQSGSGKTYALGVLLERVILHTRLPLVILDPNSDFVGLGTVRETADDAVRQASAAGSLACLKSGAQPAIPHRQEGADVIAG